MRALACVLMALSLAGCDKLTGATEQKIADAEAIGFACRVSQKQPEACMKENETQSPSSILDGWKSADEDIKAGKLDPTLSNAASPKKAAETAAKGDTPAEGEAKKDDKAADGMADAKKDGAAKDNKPVAPKDGKDKEKTHG
ncbi:MAG TPA: hypothetical protein VGK14_08435 [Novimethylophilus sp.]|jgi:hypothetical protein|uniref:hypothetical protein n=1 Tax=Novimethylophilus sp. TaxID=2137426 RepID=UPI002F3FBEDB